MMVVEWLADYCARQAEAEPDNEYVGPHVGVQHLAGITLVAHSGSASNARCATGCVLRALRQTLLAS